MWSTLKLIASLLLLALIAQPCSPLAQADSAPSFRGSSASASSPKPSGWHPLKWEDTLPAGISAVRPDGYRIVPPSSAPGVVDPAVSEAQLDSPEFIKARRNVPESEKAEVYARDNVLKIRKRFPCEVDHEVSLELGGTNDAANLWVEPYFGAWNAHDKDRLENYLHRQVKQGKLTLPEAQQDIRGACWVWSYEHYFNGPPASAQSVSEAVSR